MTFDFFDWIVDFFNMVANAFTFSFKILGDFISMLLVAGNIPMLLQEVTPPIIASCIGLLSAFAFGKFILAR